MNDEEKKEYERLKSLLYTDSLTQYGKRKLIGIIEKQQKEIENIKKEVQEHIAFENRLKRDNTEPDLFNQGRFYVANNIKYILDGKE